MTAFDELVNRLIQRHQDQLEEACEVALQSGTDGVRVVRDPMTGEHAYEVTPEVPYGTIHDYPGGRVP